MDQKTGSSAYSRIERIHISTPYSLMSRGSTPLESSRGPFELLHGLGTEGRERVDASWRVLRHLDRRLSIDLCPGEEQAGGGE